MFIGNVEIRNKAVLAPMAGVADRAFRELCRSFGAAYCVGEMVSAKGVSMRDKKSEELMQLSETERPAAIQIFGDSPEIMANAARFALKFSPDIIDINMGCPAPKIIKNNSGAALMKNPRLAGEIIKAVVNAVDVPVSVKIRKGWDGENVNALEFAILAESMGAAALTIHGRTKTQMYAPPVDLDIIKKIKENVTIPIIGNGDIDSPMDGKNMLDYTNCDLIMIGRAALGRPWLFSQINAYLNDGILENEPVIEEKMDIMLKHINSICKYKGVKNGMNEARKHAIWYTKGIRGSAQYRKRLSEIKTLDDLQKIAIEICQNNS